MFVLRRLFQQDRQMVADLSKNAVRTWIVRVVFCLWCVLLEHQENACGWKQARSG